MMSLPFFPIWLVDIFGSILMIILSFLCLSAAIELKRSDQYSVIWTYLLWLCYGLAAFAISRSAGHILKQHLIFSDRQFVWESIRPYSGAINTLTFVFVGSVTLFFERIWKIHQQVLKDKLSLQSAHEELLLLSQNLESMVAERTESLAVSEQKYRRIFEVSRDMILVSKLNGLILDMNPAGYQMLGYNNSNKDLKHKSFEDFFSDQSDWLTIINTIKKEGFIANYEVNLLGVDDRNRLSLISGSLDRGPVDKDNTVHFLIKDIEQRRFIESQMAQTDKLASIGQLSAGIAHEINNPLGIILGYAQMLMRDEEAKTGRYADLKTIEKHVKNCMSVVEDLLNFARTSKTEKEAIKIHEIIDEALNFIRHHSELYHITIEKDYDKNVPPIMLDEKKMKQVFMNLIMNAKHAVGKSGTIKLSTHYNSLTKQLAVKIADTGYGIEKKNLSRIFDPFFTTKPTGEGTGLGLSVSYGIVKNHGGEILVESAPGKGSTFTVVLTVSLKNREV
jgi:two-component system, NtrC family, sensor kinase